MLRLLSLHHARLEVADLENHERFLRSFGLVEAARDGRRSWWRTSGPQAYSLLVEPGPATRLAALAMAVESRADLLHATQALGATPVRPLAGPGGGEGVTLTMPEGVQIHLVHGIAERVTDALPAPLVFNHPLRPLRFNAEPQYPAAGPAPLLRLGHVGLFVEDFPRSEQWLREVLGLRVSDRLVAGPQHQPVSGFYRLDRGEQFVDHHVIALFGMGRSGVHHLSFEVPDVEHQFFSHRHLHAAGWEPVWGVGRHPKGSHVFDIWKDPNGLRFETFTDTDLVNRHRPPEDIPVEQARMDLWSDEPPHKYFA